LPPELIQELQKLQDKVETVDMDVEDVLENEFNISVKEHFLDIQKEPLATASIAQVYKAVLKTELLSSSSSENRTYSL
jgi:ubiquinone biosynthesis protein